MNAKVNNFVFLFSESLTQALELETGLKCYSFLSYC